MTYWPECSLRKGQKFRRTTAGRLSKAAVDPLEGFHQQLQSAHVHDVACNLSGIHALHARLDLVSHHLLVGDALESFYQQISAMLQVVAT